VRLVRIPGGAIQVDPSGRVAGRGAYLCRDAACWSRALDRGGLPRALGVGATPELRALVEAGPGQMMTITTTKTMTTETEG
jgi:predicted RNA-binding protein YlxR (DUF448 family)